LVERFINKIKNYRRVATRYGKLMANYRVFVQLASIRPWLRVAERRGAVSFAPSVIESGPLSGRPLRATNLPGQEVRHRPKTEFR
jgi:hypothetical protein